MLKIFQFWHNLIWEEPPKVFGLETNTDASLISTLKLCVGRYSPGLCAMIPPTPPLSIVHCMARVLAKILLKRAIVLPFILLTVIILSRLIH